MNNNEPFLSDIFKSKAISILLTDDIYKTLSERNSYELENMALYLMMKIEKIKLHILKNNKILKKRSKIYIYVENYYQFADITQC